MAQITIILEVSNVDPSRLDPEEMAEVMVDVYNDDQKRNYIEGRNATLDSAEWSK